jgi:hypothetical protein
MKFTIAPYFEARITPKSIRKKDNQQAAKIANELVRIGNPKALVLKKRSKAFKKEDPDHIMLYLISPEIDGDQLRVTSFEEDGYACGHQYFKTWKEALVQGVGTGTHEILDDVPCPIPVLGTTEELLEKYWSDSISKTEGRRIGLELRLMRYIPYPEIFNYKTKKSA